MRTVADILSRFGRLKDVQTALKEIGSQPPTQQAISAWQKNDRVPAWWMEPLIKAGQQRGIRIRPAELYPKAKPEARA